MTLTGRAVPARRVPRTADLLPTGDWRALLESRRRERELEVWLRSFGSERELRRCLVWRSWRRLFGRPCLGIAEAVAAWRLLVLADGLERDEISMSQAPVRRAAGGEL